MKILFLQFFKHTRIALYCIWGINRTIGNTHLKINRLYKRIPGKNLHNSLKMSIFVVDDKG